MASIWRSPHEALSAALAALREALAAATGPHGAPPVEDPPPTLAARAPQTIVILDPDQRILDTGSDVERVLGRPGADVIGCRMVLIPWSGGRGRLDVAWPDGSSHSLEYAATVGSRDTGQFVALRDVSGAGAADAVVPARDPKHALMADLRAPDRDAYALIDVLGGRVAAALGADRVGVFESSGPALPLLLRAGAGWERGAIGHAKAAGEPDAPVGLALASTDPVIIRDLRGVTEAAPALLLGSGVVSGVEVAIRPHSRPWGVLGAYSTSRRQFSVDEVDFLCAVADTLALAIDCAGIEERTREQITQLLHDEALQSLLTARQYLASAAAGDVRRHRVVGARDAVHRAIRELRAAVSGLHPAVVEAVKLREVMEAAIEQQSLRGGFEATVEFDLEPDEAWAPLLLSLARDLTANVAEHAQASHVHVRIEHAGDGLALEVSDDGSGIAPGRVEEALAEGHIGLASAARRVSALGGKLTIESTAGEGTRVRVELPRPGRPGPGPFGAGTGAE